MKDSKKKKKGGGGGEGWVEPRSKSFNSIEKKIPKRRKEKKIVLLPSKNVIWVKIPYAVTFFFF